MIENNFFILSGAPGSGKSTLLQHLRTLGYQCVDEPARQIIAEQRRVRGAGPRVKDDRLFVDLMLYKMIYEYLLLRSSTPPVFFDRGIPDALGYASHFGFDYAPGRAAATEYRYNQRVFFAPAWEEIYTTDEERIISFEVARQFGDKLRAVYEQLGYDLVELPCVSVEERAEFILTFL